MKLTKENWFSRKTLFYLALAWVGALTAGSQTSASGRELFNGRDFTGWTFFMRSNAAPENTWSISNGVIHCTGKPAGYLRTEKSFTDYALTVEWRFVKVTPKSNNTGILVHIQLPEKIWPKCIECQGQDQKQGDFWLHSGAAAGGYPNDGKKSVNVPKTSPPNENLVGEWNTYQVITHGNTVEIIVNGKSMNKISGANASSGFIGIQSEGAEIEVRKIYLESKSK
jgi:hypothetical protein